MLAFVHIPRTGGGTFSSAISKNYSRLQGPGNYQKNADATRSGVERIGRENVKKAVGDHIPYGLYLRHLPADTRYVTVLRDPVDRVLSHYHFHLQAGKRPEQGRQKLLTIWQDLLNNARLEREGGEQEAEIVIEPDADPSLAEGLRRKIPIYDNFMTRFLWGGESLFGELPPDAAERAKENISKFWFVAINERLDDSIVLLGKKLGIGPMPYYLRHVSQKRPPLDDTPDELRELIVEHNAMDAELYQFAREQFDAANPPPAKLAKEVEELRQLSIAVTEEGEAFRATQGERRTAKRAARAERETRRAEARAQRAAGKGAAASAAPEGAKGKKAKRANTTPEERRTARQAARAERETRRAEIRAERAAAKATGEDASAPEGKKDKKDKKDKRDRQPKPREKTKARHAGSEPPAEPEAEASD